jgi:hypothetical protein
MTPLDWLGLFLSIPGMILSFVLPYWMFAFVLALVGGVAYYLVQAVRGKL